MIRLMDGGAGMVIKPDVVYDAFKSIESKNAKTIYLSPKGKVLNQKKVKDLSCEEHLILLCGHYEGIDQRVLDEIVNAAPSYSSWASASQMMPSSPYSATTCIS